VIVEDLPRPAPERDIADLASLLVDAVASGASVGFLPPLSLEEAARWWRETLPRAQVLVARDAAGIVGTVQLQPARAANQPHRAEVAKLLVHRRARRRGIGRALMAAVETRARAEGWTLLTLDTKRGDAAESLYRRLGWTCAGVIPGYALDGTGTLCATVIFYRAFGDGV
jgi:GNAT superfamily N-acetyltransferase